MEVALFMIKNQRELGAISSILLSLPVPEMIGQARTMALVVFLLLLLLGTAAVSSALSIPDISLPFLPTDGWSNAHATFYGDETASETMGGACGYGNLFATGYGTATAALSTVLYLGGFSCGRCFQIRCSGSAYCNTGFPSITVTATNLCPPNLALPTNNGGWCNPPRSHFDLSKPAFMKIAYWRAGIVPVMYRRVACSRSGGVRFLLQGNGYWLLAFVMNVGASGDVGSLWVKGSRSTDWIKMSHSWGASFQAFSRLSGQSLSFKVVSYTTGQTILANNVAPTNWWPGMTYQAQVNFT